MPPSPDEATEQDLVSVGDPRLRREHRLAVARNERLVLDGGFLEMAVIVSTGAGAVFFDCAPVPTRWFVDEPAFGIFAGPDPLIARSAAKHSAGALVEGTRGFPR